MAVIQSWLGDVRENRERQERGWTLCVLRDEGQRNAEREQAGAEQATGVHRHLFLLSTAAGMP